MSNRPEDEREQIDMSYFIDMHNHIVPGVDDGSAAMDESMALIDMEYKEGVRKIICTPHYIRNRNNYDYSGLEKTFEELKEKVAERYPDMKLYLGNEVLCEPGITDDIRKSMTSRSDENQKGVDTVSTDNNTRLIHTMAGSKYMLFEFNIRIPYHELYDTMKAIVETRVRPIIAHVERYQALTGHIDRIEELKALGIYLQINADSVEGSIFDEKTRWVRKLITGGYIEFISTDCHDPESRIPNLKGAVLWIRKKCGQETVDALFRENAEKVIRNEYIPIDM